MLGEQSGELESVRIYNDGIKEILQKQDVKIEKTLYALDQKMMKFDPREFGLVGKVQFENDFNSL